MDYDLMTAPKLLTVRHNGKPVDIVAQAGKKSRTDYCAAGFETFWQGIAVL